MDKIRIYGHFGEFLQGKTGGEIALVSCPCPALFVDAHFIGVDQKDGDQKNVGNILSDQEIQQVLSPFSIEHENFTLKSDIPKFGGAGLSTASRLALLELVTSNMSAIEKAKYLLGIEGAVDPLMFEHFERILWASRQAEILESLPQLPKMKIIGGFWGAGELTRKEDNHFADITDLIETWKNASGLGRIAQLSSESSKRNFSYRQKCDEPILALEKPSQALGIISAHTGSARGLIFPPDADVSHAKEMLLEAGFVQITEFVLGEL